MLRGSPLDTIFRNQPPRPTDLSSLISEPGFDWQRYGVYFSREGSIGSE